MAAKGDADLTVEADDTPSQNNAHAEPLVAVTFQKNPRQKHKFLESEPKALGITQICLAVFYISGTICFGLKPEQIPLEFGITEIIASLVVIVAGALAIAAQNLHPPTLKACLAFQVMTSIVAVFNMIGASANTGDQAYSCWPYKNSTLVVQLCHSYFDATAHYHAETIVIQAALIAISITLAAYCCKVIPCCSPPERMPVITVQAPISQQ